MSANGFIACGPDSVQGIDTSVTQDSGGGATAPGAVQQQLSGSGPRGSALFLNTLAIGTHIRICPALFCTDTDGIMDRGTPSTSLATTGTAEAVVLNANGQNGLEIVDPTTGAPYSVTGHPANCDALASTAPSLKGFSGAFALPSLDLRTVGDIVVTGQVVVQ